MKIRKFSLVLIPNKVQSAPCNGYFVAVQVGKKVNVYCKEYDGQIAGQCHWQFTKVGDKLPEGMGQVREIFTTGGKDYTLSASCIVSV